MADPRVQQRLLTFLLLPAIVVAVLVLDGVTFRNSFQLEKLREQSVLEATLLLANEKADRLEKRIIDQDNLVASTVDTEERANFGNNWLSIARTQTPTVRAVFLLDATSRDREVLAIASRFPGIEDERFRRLLLTSLLSEMKLSDQPPSELRHLHCGVDTQSHLLSYWQRESRGRRYLLVAWHDVAAIVRHVFSDLYPETDQASRVNVVDSENKLVYGRPIGRESLVLGRQFETTLYKWRLNVSMTSAQDLAQAVARRRVLEMVMVGLSGLVVIGGSVVILVAAARERKLSNLKSEFVANVSHELRTPLSLVRMFGELLQSGRVESEEKRREYLQIIVTETERLGALIENVLDFAKLERGKASYRFVERDLGEVLRRAVEMCRPRAERDGVTLELVLLSPCPPFPLDEHAVEIATINLLDNALKYAEGSKQIRVIVDERDGQATVSVEDQGPGLAEDETHRVFERFVRGRATREKRVRGSGIGLALVKHIAEAHQGRAWVERVDPRGARFCFSLALRRSRLASVSDHGVA